MRPRPTAMHAGPVRIAKGLGGICAGAILLTGCVSHVGQTSLGADGLGTNQSTLEDNEVRSVRVDPQWDWAVLYAATEVSSTDTFEGMREEADFVALGKFTQPCTRRSVGSGTLGDTALLGCLTFRPSRILAGQAGAESYSVEFLGDPGDTAPSGEILIFMLDKGGSEAGRYVVVNSHGLLTSTVRAIADQPMREEPPSPREMAARHLDTSSWETFVASVEAQLD